MRKLNEWIDRFCARHPGWGIPNLMRYVVFGTAAVYVLIFLTAYKILPLLGLSVSGILRGQVWRIVTFLFVPTNMQPLFLLLSLYFYYWMGSVLESYWGTARFTIYYASGALLTVIASFVIYFSGGGDANYGIHYVNMAMFLAYAAMNPEGIVHVFYILPVKMKWLAYIDLAYFAYAVLTGIAARSWGHAVAPIIALLNFFVFFYPHFDRRVQIERRRSSKQAKKFRAAMHRQIETEGYRHKCTVCGRTDKDFPDLQFRYCSKCAGYHCFCSDHLFTHTHFTDE